MSDNVGATTPSRSVVIVVSLMGLALLIYTPWHAAPFDILDFSELLPILRDSESFLDTFRSVAGYYRDHGRSNPVTSAFIALNWELFGEAPLDWRLFRTAVMGLALGLTVWFLRRLGFSMPALFGGASIVVVALSSAGNWLRLTGEPIAFACLILALVHAAGYRHEARWGPRLFVMTCLVASLLLTKETMLAVVPAVAGVALTADSRFVGSRPENDRRTWMLIAAVTVIAGLFLGAASWIASSTNAGAYVRTYGEVGVQIRSFSRGLQRIFFPMGDVDGPLVWWNVLFAGFVVVGAALACLGPDRGRARLLVSLGAYLILAGAGVYVPWGRFEFFYGLPFSLGTILLVTVATEELMRRAGANRSLVFGGLVIALATPATLSQLFAARTYATRQLNWEIARELWRSPPADSFVVAVEGLPAQEWQGQAPTLRRVASLLQRVPATSLPPAVDRECGVALGLAADPPFRVLLLSYEPGCGPLPDPDRTYARDFTYARVAGFAAAHGQVRAYLRLPPEDSVSSAASR